MLLSRKKEAAGNKALTEDVFRINTSIDSNYTNYGYFKGLLLFIVYFISSTSVSEHFKYYHEKRRWKWGYIRYALRNETEDHNTLIEDATELISLLKKVILQTICASVVFAHLAVFCLISFRRVYKHHKQVLKAGGNIYSGCAIWMASYITFTCIFWALLYAWDAAECYKDVPKVSDVLKGLMERG